MHRNQLLFVTVLALGIGPSCADKVTAPPDPELLEPPSGPVARSARGNLRFKGPERINQDFAAALELRPDAVCLELGQYSCTGLVHNVALGGVDPYGPGLYESSGVTASTTPLAVERVAWAACTQRVDTDLATPAASVIFREVPLTGKKLASPDGAEVRGVIGLLTQRVLLRNPYRNEVERYVRLAKDIEFTGNTEPARAWMQAVCFAILTSTESVFY